VLLSELVATSEAVRATPARSAKIEALAAALRRAAPDEIAAAVAFLSGELRQRQIGVGWASLRELPPPAAEPSLAVGEVDVACERIGALSGPGSQAARRAALGALFARATAPEQPFLRGVLTGELRQGAQAGVMVEAVARATAVPRDAIRRALMLSGDLGAVTAAARASGAAGLAAIGLEVGRPVQPMLAAPAADVEDALARVHPAAVEFKLDGARLQVHRRDEDVAVFTRSLDDVTARLPEVVEAALALPARSLVLDGEAIALRPDGRPHPFQVTGSRLGSRRAVEELRRSVPVTALFFDVLHLDGEDLLDRPGAERHAALAARVPEAQRVPRAVTEDAPGAAAVLADALDRGHEGIVVKSLAAPYEAGRRGAGWLKVKPRHTLDLVVLAAEWGHGRRRGWLSNLHLGAREPGGEGFVMLGKTFKGLTDAMLDWQTERLLALEVARDAWTVRVRPELVVEIAFDGVQTSPRYPGGVALRFARVLRHRPDKTAAEADTLDAVLAVAARAG
jgi:DNA ligase-1